MSTRDLKIKTGKVSRTRKEYLSYQQEKAKQESRIEQMKKDGKGEHEIRKQEEVLQETVVMLPDTRMRLSQYMEELVDFTKSLTDDNIRESEDFKAALSAIEEARAAI
eukprot:Rmarinus@m.28292